VDGIEVPLIDSGVAAADAWAAEDHEGLDATRQFSRVLDSTASPLELDITSSVAVEFDVAKYASPTK